MGIFSRIFKAVTNLLGDVLGFLIGADFDDQSQAEGVLVNKSSNIANIPVIYGERKVGGTRVFLATGGGKKNEYLYMALVLAEGEVQEIGDVYINDTLSTDTKYSGLVSIQKFLGSDNQTYSTLLAGSDETWGADHRLRGVAYLAIRLKYDEKALTSIPDIKAIVKGRKVYDPRTGSTAYSNNPALCLRDYMTNSRYGKGLPSVQIDDTAFSTAANVCDTLVTEYSGSSTVKLLTCNAVLDTNKKLFDNVKILLQGMRGLMPFQDGKYSLLIDSAVSGTRFRLDDSNITSKISVKGAGKNRKFNRVRAKFVNPEANWQEDSVDWPANDSTYTGFLSEDNGEELLREITLNTITSYYAARDLARIVCRASREHQLTVEVTATSEALQIAVGDVVELENDSLGWTGASIKELRVLAMSLQESGEVALTLQEYTNVYTYDSGPVQSDSLETQLDDPFNVEPPTNLSLVTGVQFGAEGEAIPYIDVSWTAADDALVTSYIINIIPSGFDPYEVALTTPKSDGTDATAYLIQPAFVTTYTIEVRAQNANGVRSDPISGNIVVTGDTVAPSACTNLTATGGPQAIHLVWDNPSDVDFSFAQIQRRVYQTGSYVTVASLFGAPSSKSSYVDGGLADNVRYQYRVRAYDWSGNASVFSNIADATTDGAGLTTGDLEPRSANGYVYLQTPTADTVTSVTTPSATSYNWETGQFFGLTLGWSIDPPEVDPIGTAGDGLKYWAARFYVTETIYNGTQELNFSTPFASFLFDGLVTFSNLNTELADAASSLLTTIDGGLIKTGVVDLANQHGMAVRQGKTAYSSTTAGFWIGNDGGTAKINVGDTNNYLRWDGNDLVATGLEVRALDGTLLLDAGGRFQTVTESIGSNLIFNGDFSKGSTGWVDWDAANYQSVVFDEYEGTATATSTGTQPARAVMDTFIKVTEGETLYLYSIAEGIDGGMALEWFSDNGSGTKTYEGASAFSGTGVNQGADDDQAFSSTKLLRHVKVTVPTSTTTGNVTRYVRALIENVNTNSNTSVFYEIGLTRTPIVINPSYAGTYIRDLSVDTLQIQDNAVTVPSTIQYGTSSYFTNAIETAVSGTTLAVDFGTNVPNKVILMALSVLGSSGFGTDWAAAQLRLRYNTTNSTTISGSVEVAGVQINARKGGPPTLNITKTVDGWSGTRYFFLTVKVTGETTSATGWWRNGDANISIFGAKK